VSQGIIQVGGQATRVELTGAEILAETLSADRRAWQVGRGPVDGDRIVVGTPASSPLVSGKAREWQLDELGDEGFVARRIDSPTGPFTVIASAGARGVLYGCAAVAERARLGEPLERIDLRDRPVLAERNLWDWGGDGDEPDHLFHPDRMLHAETDPGFQRLGRFLAQGRFNALTFWPRGSLRPDIGPDRDKSLDAWRAATRFLRGHLGVDCYLFMWYEIKQGTPTPIHGWPICTFNQRVIDYWNERIDRLIRELPDLRGIVMAGAGGDWVRGPWECQCPQCRTHTDRDLLLRAMEMIGKRWVEAGGRIIWKAVTDRPNLVKSEVEHFADLDDSLPPYVKIAHKPFYKDFRPVSPLHPLLFAHQDQNERTRPYLCEFQIFGEYRGLAEFPCVMVDRWSEIAPMVARKGYAGMMGICVLRWIEGWDHPLNMANWYALGRYAWNPNASPEEIYRDWACQAFGPAAAGAVIEICRLSYQASTKMMFFKGVMTQNHSKLPTIDYELESSLVGPWHHLPKAPDGYVGRSHDVSMYPAEVAGQIRNDPNVRLWAHHVPLTPELCDEAIAEKREAWQIVREMSAKWAAIPHDGWEALHRDIAERFERNVVDFELWYEDLRLYFDYKAGRLTRAELGRRLADLRARFHRDAGSGLIHETFDRFFEEWQRVYDGNLVRRSMEGDYHNPAGEPFLPGPKPE
jgi:alpha-glucuronidase